MIVTVKMVKEATTPARLAELMRAEMEWYPEEIAMWQLLSRGAEMLSPTPKPFRPFGADGVDTGGPPLTPEAQAAIAKAVESGWSDPTQPTKETKDHE